MLSHADIASQLLKEAGQFFRVVATQNDSVAAQMMNNAVIYEKAAALIYSQPEGQKSAVERSNVRKRPRF